MTLRRTLVVALLATFAACGGDGPVDPGPGTPTVASVSVSSPASTVKAGQTVQYSASARDSDGGNVTGVSVSWSSSDTQVATIDANGLATGVSEGTASISATISGVSGQQALTVLPDECQARQTVTLDPGETATFATADCLLLPSGSNGDLYRVAYARVSEAGNPADVVTASVQVTALSAQGQQAAASVASASVRAPERTGPKRGIDGTVIMRDLELRQTTRRFHARLRAREQLMDFGELPIGDSPVRSVAVQADPPATTSFNASLTCSGSPTPATLLAFNDDVAFYQDSGQNATAPIQATAANRLVTFYTDYVKDMLAQNWGTLSDLDGNGRLVVTTSPILADTVLGAVFSGDLNTSGTCVGGNQMELVYMSSSIVARMDDTNSPSFAALGTLAHEAKHVVSLRNRVVAAQNAGGGTALFHPLWYEEGQAELAETMASRIAWAATGGPPLGTPVTATHILNAVGNNAGRQTPEMWGLIEKLANTVATLSTHPNSLITNPQGANEFHTFYATGWHFARFLGDAYGNAATPGSEAALLLQLNDQSTLTGSQRLMAITGKTFSQHLEELAIGAMFAGSTPAPSLAFTTLDWVTATDIFTAPAVLDPDGVYPWPVTSSGDNTSAGFVTATYSGPVGPAAFRIHEFASGGSGLGIQLEFGGDPNARIIVARLR